MISFLQSLVSVVLLLVSFSEFAFSFQSNGPLFVSTRPFTCRGFSRSFPCSFEPVSVKPIFDGTALFSTREQPGSGSLSSAAGSATPNSVPNDATWGNTNYNTNKRQFQLSAATTDTLGGVPLSPPPQDLIVPPPQSQTTSQEAEYNRGLLVTGIVTLIFASHSPVAHGGLAAANVAPPVLLLNAAAAVVAFLGVSGVQAFRNKEEGPVINDDITVRAGFELGLCKTLGATANFYGLALTSSNHGAFLIQLTTLIVPVMQGLMGVPLSKKTWSAVALAMMGVLIFTQGGGAAGEVSLVGDGLCVLAACFYALYDLRLNKWGDKVQPLTVIRNKVFFQAVFSSILLFAFGSHEAVEYVSDFVSSHLSTTDMELAAFVALWNGFLVNAGASVIQVRAQNAIGATKAQIVYATQPLMAAGLSWAFLHETVSPIGMFGAAMFMGALMLASDKDE